MNHTLRLQPVNPGVCQVHTSAGLYVGNLKLIGGLWKFKAIGFDASGQVIPGGGPLTDRHNATFNGLDEADINRVLA